MVAERGTPAPRWKRPARGSILILVGMPGVGKTTVGRRCAARLGWRFVDLDEAVGAREGLSITELFAAKGEAGFRRAERDALQETLRDASARLVLAVGGGAPCEGDNLERMRAAGSVVYLRARLGTLATRTGGGGRPLLRGDRKERLQALLRRRAATFERADMIVDTDGRDVEDVVTDLIKRLSLGESGADRD